MSVKQIDPHTLKVTYSSDGKVRRENTFVLSADGKTITETDVTPDPSPSTMSLCFISRRSILYPGPPAQA